MTTLSEIRELAQSATKDNHVGKFARAIQGLCDYIDNFPAEQVAPFCNSGTRRTAAEIISKAVESVGDIDGESSGTPRTAKQKTAGEVAAETLTRIEGKLIRLDRPDNTMLYFGIPSPTVEPKESLKTFRAYLAAIIDAEIAKEREACAETADKRAMGYAVDSHSRNAAAMVSVDIRNRK